MLKRLFLLTCLSSSAFCFERGAELFENKKYLESAKAFLTEAKKNDVRVPFYIRFLSEENLVNPQDLGEEIEKEWNDCLQNRVPFAPIDLGRGEIYLQISFLAQDLIKATIIKEAELTLSKIRTISDEQKIGYGFYVVARFLEKQSKINRNLANQIVSAYQKGADCAHRLSILSLVDLPSKLQKLLPKLKVDPMYIQESKVLSAHQFSIGEAEKTISRYYDGAQNIYGMFLMNTNRKGLWQYEAARQGNADLQITFHKYCAYFQKILLIAPPRDDEADRWLYFAALGGESQSLTRLGSLFFHGNNTLFPKEKSRALSFCEAAISIFIQKKDLKNENLKNSLMIAGNILDKGEDVPQNNEKTFKYYQLAADQFKDPIAIFNTGCMLEHGRGVPKDGTTARTCFEKAFDLGDGEAAWLIGTRHLDGSDGYERDLKKALHYLDIAATKGKPKALYDLYLIYGCHLTDMEAENYPVLQDNEKAWGYLKKSAVAGYDNAQKTWALKAFNRKDSLPEDEGERLVEYLERHSHQSVSLKAGLGIILMKGYRIVACDGERALKLLREAANEGNEENAFSALGSIYERGECGVEKNDDTARGYYEKSQGIAASVTNLGYFYEMGRGSLVKNGDKAIELYNKALEMKNGGAAYNLGALYQNGKFVGKNEAKAFFYYKLGYELGNPDASYQYASYLWQGLCCDKDIQGAKDILLSLDPSSPDVAFTLAAIQWNDNETKSPSIFQRVAEEGMPLGQYTYGLLLYLANLSANTKIQMMLQESKIFIERAEKNGFKAASSALNLLFNRSPIGNEETGLIIKKLLKMDIEGARAVRHKYAQDQFEEIEQENQVEMSLKVTAEALLQRDPEVARLRQEQYLEYFTDPLNRKNVSVKGLYKIAAAQASQQGGRIESARGGGSGVKIKVGDNATGFHGMHRAGQSSRATLDPGRAKSFTDFAEKVSK